MIRNFRIEYDDHPNDVVNNISTILKEFGITITELDGGDGYNEYEIKQYNDKSIYSLISDKLNSFKIDNYHETLSGAMALNSDKECDCCGKSNTNLFIFERYINNGNDLETKCLCSTCQHIFYNI